MKHFLKTAIIAAALMSATTQFAHSDQFVTRGLGTMTCAKALTYARGDQGTLLLMNYAGGFLNAMNGLASLNDKLPGSLDVANGEQTENIVRMVRLTCKKHPDMDFDKSLLTIISRLNDAANKENALAQ